MKIVHTKQISFSMKFQQIQEILVDLLLDEKGLMVGVNSFQKSDSELINFSVAIEEVEKFLKEEIKRRKT